MIHQSRPSWAGGSPQYAGKAPERPHNSNRRTPGMVGDTVPSCLLEQTCPRSLTHSRSH